MKYGRNLFATQEEKGKTGYIYGGLHRDALFLMGEDRSIRFAPLARKVLRHYAKDAYDPYTIEFHIEWWVRKHIANFVDIKVRHKVQYDWEFLDNYFKKVIGTLMKIDIPYDPNRLEYVIPEARVPDSIDTDTN